MSDYVEAMKTLGQSAKGGQGSSAQPNSNWLDAYGQNQSGGNWSDYYNNYKAQFGGQQPEGYQGGGYGMVMGSGGQNTKGPQTQFMMNALNNQWGQQFGDLQNQYSQMFQGAANAQQQKLNEYQQWMQNYWDNQNNQSNALFDYLKGLQGGDSQPTEPAQPPQSGPYPDLMTGGFSTGDIQGSIDHILATNPDKQTAYQHIYNLAKQHGVSLDLVGSLMGFTPAEVSQWVQAYGGGSSAGGLVPPPPTEPAPPAEPPQTTPPPQQPSQPYVPPDMTQYKYDVSQGATGSVHKGSPVGYKLPAGVTTGTSPAPAPKPKPVDLSKHPGVVPNASGGYTPKQLQDTAKQIMASAPNANAGYASVLKTAISNNVSPHVAGRALGFTPKEVDEWMKSQGIKL